MKKILLFITCFTTLQCSSSGGDFFSKIFPSGLSITSPTTPGSSDSATNELNAIGAFDSTKDFSKKKQVLQNLASGNDECTFVFPSFIPPFNDPACYGPVLYFKNHPDTPPMTTPSNCIDKPWPCLPSGDLGIFSEEEGEQACAAAKLNTELGNVGQKVDAALLFIAGISCLIESDGDLDIPTEGQSIDLTALLSDALQEDNPNITVAAASLERLADASDGMETFQYEITAQDTSGREFKINLKHHPTDTSGSNFKGKLWSSFESGNSTEFVTANSFAFSLLYEREEDTLNYHMLSTAYSRATVSDFDIGMFDADNNVDPTACSGANCWEGFAQTIGNIDINTGLGAASYGWQAGTNDSEGSTKLARILNFYTDEGDDITKGYAFFGYGRGFDKDTGNIGSNKINRFICNWSGPGNLHSGIEDNAQKQVMTYNETTGVFRSSSANIAYAPTNACSYDAGSGTLAFSTDSLVDLDDSDNEASSITNDLVDLTTDPDFANYVAPTVPVEDF